MASPEQWAVEGELWAIGSGWHQKETLFLLRWLQQCKQAVGSEKWEVQDRECKRVDLGLGAVLGFNLGLGAVLGIDLGLG